MFTAALLTSILVSNEQILPQMGTRRGNGMTVVLRVNISVESPKQVGGLDGGTLLTSERQRHPWSIGRGPCDDGHPW
jgi:hypothetical protein